jgi:hypothetical protein
MKQISIEKDVYVKLEAKAKQKNLTPQEYISQLIHENTGFLPVTVQVPENIMRLLIAEGFFHENQDEWFTNAVIHYCQAELGELDIQTEDSLKQKYHLE